MHTEETMQFGNKSKKVNRIFIRNYASILADRRGKLKFIIGETELFLAPPPPLLLRYDNGGGRVSAWLTAM